MTLDWSLLFSVVAAGASVWGLTIMKSQLRVARDAAGGRGIEVSAYPDGTQTVVNDEELPHEYFLQVKLIGPGIRHGVAIHLEGASSTKAEERPRMDCESEPLVNSARLTDDKATSCWWVISWLDASGEGVRTGAIRSRPDGSKLEVWKWKFGYKVRRFFQNLVGRSKPLGKWKPRPGPSLKPGQGPIGSVRAEMGRC